MNEADRGSYLNEAGVQAVERLDADADTLRWIEEHPDMPTPDDGEDVMSYLLRVSRWSRAMRLGLA